MKAERICFLSIDLARVRSRWGESPPFYPLASRGNRYKSQRVLEAMMKQKLSVSLEKGLVRKVKALLKEGKFRNRSHLIEYALRVYLEREPR